MLVIANGRYAGGGIPFARLAVLVPRVLAGRHLADPNVEHTRARTVSVEAEPGFWFNVDGETWFSGSATFELRPRALPFIRP